MGKTKRKRGLRQLNTAREVRVSSMHSGGIKKSFCILKNVFPWGMKKNKEFRVLSGLPKQKEIEL